MELSGRAAVLEIPNQSFYCKKNDSFDGWLTQNYRSFDESFHRRDDGNNRRGSRERNSRSPRDRGRDRDRSPKNDVY